MSTDAKNLFVEQLQELLHADRISRDATKAMAEHASSDALKTALDNGVCGIGDGIEVVEGLLQKHGASTDGRSNAGMEGLVADSVRGALDREFKDADARDDAIIMHFQRFTHFGLASYAALCASAKRIGLSDDAETLATCLNNAGDGKTEMQAILDNRGQ